MNSFIRRAIDVEQQDTIETAKLLVKLAAPRIGVVIDDVVSQENFRLKLTCQFKNLMSVYARKHKIQQDNISFFFHSVPIHLEKTPQDYGIIEGNIINVRYIAKQVF